MVNLYNKALGKVTDTERGKSNKHSFISGKIHYFPSLIIVVGSNWDPAPWTFPLSF